MLTAALFALSPFFIFSASRVAFASAFSLYNKIQTITSTEYYNKRIIKVIGTSVSPH